jgi:hypothetical protein
MSPSWSGYLYSLSKKELVLVLIVFLSEGSFYGQKKWNLLLFGNKIPQKIDRNLPKKR